MEEMWFPIYEQIYKTDDILFGPKVCPYVTLDQWNWDSYKIDPPDEMEHFKGFFVDM
jgi:hypothetical protein